MKKITLSLVLLLFAVALTACNDNPLNVNFTNAPVTEIRDSIPSEYMQGKEFMVLYSLGIVPGLRIDSVERYSNPPTSIIYGKLIIYYNNVFYDSIPYGGAYHWSGFTRPYTAVGQMPNGKYLVRIKTEHDQMYYSGKSLWYIADNTNLTPIAKDSVLTINGMCERDGVSLGNVRKFQNKVIWQGYYYCYKELYCTLNDNIFKNYYRFRPDCYSSWQWFE